MNTAKTRYPDRGRAVDAYLRDLAEIGELAPEREAELAARVAGGDAEAREELIRASLPVVPRIARRYAGLGVPVADLISEGNLGLIRAADLFEPRHGLAFRIYAAYWARHKMLRALSSQHGSIRRPIRMPKQSPEAESGAEGTSGEGASSTRTVPVEVPFDNGAETETDLSLAERLADPRAINPGEALEQSEVRDDVLTALDTLDDREFQILALKFGLGGSKRSYRQIAPSMGISREWARRIGSAALGRLRTVINQLRTKPAEIRRAMRERAEMRLALLA